MFCAFSVVCVRVRVLSSIRSTPNYSFLLLRHSIYFCFLFWHDKGAGLPLDVETVLGVLSACRQEISTMFGYAEENRGVGITGGVDFVDLDGPIVIISLKGRFWHEEPMVVQRVKSYLMARIPELVDVIREEY